MIIYYFCIQVSLICRKRRMPTDRSNIKGRVLQDISDLKVLKKRFNIIFFVIRYASSVYSNDVESFTIIESPFF